MSVPVVRYLTHGPLATETVELDFERGAFLVLESGAMVPGTINGSGIFTPSGTFRDNVYLVDRIQRDADVLAMFVGLQDMQREAFRDVHFEADAGCTQTIIKAKAPCVLPQAAATASHLLYIGDDLDGVPRKAYVVDSVVGVDVTLTGAMSEPAPASGTLCVLAAKRKLLPRAADFTAGSIGFKIGANQFVVQETDGGIFRATATTDLAKIASGSGACDLPVGFVEGNANVTVTMKPRGRWDNGALGGALTTAAAHQLRRGARDAHEIFTGAEGEATYDTQRKIIVVHDGATVGGEPLGKLDQFSGTEHATGAYRGAKAVYEKAFSFAVVVGNSTQAHGIPAPYHSALIAMEVSWSLPIAGLPLTFGPGFNPEFQSGFLAYLDDTFLHSVVDSPYLGGLAMTCHVRLTYTKT